MKVIIVSGVLKECANSLLEDEMFLSFTRTFILRPYSKNQGILKNSYEYKIFNEQLHLQNASALQTDNAFKVKGLIEDELEEKNRDLMPTEFEDQEANFLIFKDLTELNHSWCIK